MISRAGSGASVSDAKTFYSFLDVPVLLIIPFIRRHVLVDPPEPLSRLGLDQKRPDCHPELTPPFPFLLRHFHVFYSAFQIVSCPFSSVFGLRPTVLLDRTRYMHSHSPIKCP